MKKLIITAVFCLLAMASPVSAQLIIHNNGNSELGVNPFDPENTTINPQLLNYLDTVTVLRIFGRYGDQAAGGHLTFGDTYLYNTYNVLVGELGYTDCDKLWLHGKDGTTGSCKTSSSSITLNNISPNSTIMLNKHNYIPYIAPLVLQNTDLEQSQYVFATDVTAGHSVDSGRTSGDVTVKEGSEYEIEASGEVTLAGGFSVELGARFAVKRTSYK